MFFRRTRGGGKKNANDDPGNSRNMCKCSLRITCEAGMTNGRATHCCPAHTAKTCKNVVWVSICFMVALRFRGAQHAKNLKPCENMMLATTTPRLNMLSPSVCSGLRIATIRQDHTPHTDCVFSILSWAKIQV